MSMSEMMNFISTFKYSIIVGILLSVAAAIIGVVLVLKRYSLIGDGLSHFSFGAIAVALSLGLTVQVSVLIAIPVAIVFAFLILKLGQNTRIKGDALIGIMSCSALSIAYIVMKITGTSINFEQYFFGIINLAELDDVIMVLPIFIILIVILILGYNRIFSITFDEKFAKATGTHVGVYNGVFAVLSAIIIVLGMRIMGTLLISAILIFPALSSMRVFNKFKTVIISSAVISLICFVVAFFFLIDYPSGASIVLVNLIVFIVFTITGKIIRAVKK